MYTTTRIKAIKKIGIVRTMDIRMANKTHTFYANGLATSNSHSVSYSIISMWDAYLKTYYPGEFYASCLSYLNEDKRVEIIEEAASRDIGVILPKYNLSKALLWNYDPKKNVLVMPFAEIEGVGEKTALEVEKTCRAVRKTFFGNRTNLGSVSGSVKMSLSKIKADNPDWRPGYKDIPNIKHLFKYNLKKILFEQN